jgi:hypothetical protein
MAAGLQSQFLSYETLDRQAQSKEALWSKVLERHGAIFYERDFIGAPCLKAVEKRTESCIALI